MEQPAHTEQVDAEAAGPPAADAPVPAPPLQRSATNRLIGGVCGGLAERTDIDPILYRVVTAVLVLVGGAGLILYGAAMLFIPDARSGRAPIDHVIPRGTHRNVGVATVLLAIVCALVVVGGLTGVFGGGSISLVVLAVLALLVAHRRGADLRHAFRGSPTPPRQQPPGPQLPGGPAPQAFAPGPQPGGRVGPDAPTMPLPIRPPSPGIPPPAAQPTQYVDLAAYGYRQQPTQPPPPRPPKAPSITFLVWVAAVAVGVGVYLLQQHDRMPGDIRVPLAAALGTLGVGLFASAWVGRARVKGWGVLLTLALGAATVLSGTAQHIDFHPVTWAPTSAAALAAHQPYRQTVGDARLDLTQFPAAGGRTYHASVRMTAGQLTVLVPKSADVNVTLRCSGCVGTVLGDRIGGDDGEHEGGRVNLTRSYPSGSADAPVMDLAMRVTAGDVEVRRVA